MRGRLVGTAPALHRRPPTPSGISTESLRPAILVAPAAGAFLAWLVRAANLVTPRIQKHVASVPSLRLIGGQLLVGVVVGIAGVMFAAPLLLAVMVTVQVVHLRHALGDGVSTPQEG